MPVEEGERGRGRGKGERGSLGVSWVNWSGNGKGESWNPFSELVQEGKGGDFGFL
jgi:hypothetical protein